MPTTFRPCGPDGAVAPIASAAALDARRLTEAEGNRAASPPKPHSDGCAAVERRRPADHLPRKDGIRP